MSERAVCIGHIAELFLFEYYENPGEYEAGDPDVFRGLKEKAEEEEKRGGYPAALQNYEKALALNPADVSLRFGILRCDYHLHRLDEMHEETLRLYPYLCTRQELAGFYRFLGCWYLETYQPETAECLYRYSLLFAPSGQAEQDIRYLETALKRPMPEYSVAELQERLQKEQIPLRASNVTMALLVKAAEEAEKKQLWQQELDCWRMVYDLTQDEEIGRKIRSLSKK